MNTPKTYKYLKEQIKRLKDNIKYNESEIKQYQEMLDEILEE